MNYNILKSKMALYGDTNKTLAKKLKITPSALTYKLKGVNKFKLKEMDYIKKEYELSYEEFYLIFFGNLSTKR